MWFFATLLEASKGSLFATSSTILYPGAAMRNVSRLLNLTLLIILLLASCDVKVQSKSDVDQLCQANEHNKLYEWVIARLSSSTIAEIERDAPLLSDAISCIISHYRSLDSTSAEAISIRMWLSNIESFHFSRSDVRELEIIPRIFLSNQYQFQEFDKLFKLYIENETNNIPSIIDSMFHCYQSDLFRAAYDNFISLRLPPRSQHVTLKSLLTKFSPYVLPNEGSEGLTWCDSIMESLNIEIERAKKINEENARRAKALGDELQRAESELETLQEELERIENFDDELNSLAEKVKLLKDEVNQAYHGKNRMMRINGNIIGLSSQTSYSNIYECSDNRGNRFLVETIYTSFNSQGSFSLYAEYLYDVEITTINGFHQKWPKWGEVSGEDYKDYMEDRADLKKELAEAKTLLAGRANKAPKNSAKAVKNLKRKITKASLQVINIKARLEDLRITRYPILRNSATDIDGNTYGTVVIGEQEWMTENLVVTHYRDGTEIPNITSELSWKSTSSGAYCYYDNNSSIGDIYGALYNWYAVTNDRNIAPEGWHVPTETEWQTLVDYLGGKSVAGLHLKEVGTSHWNSPNTGVTNESGFTVLPGGSRDYEYGSYNNMGNNAYFWSATQVITANAWYLTLSYQHSTVGRFSYDKRQGFSIRLVRD